jgi:hypothetical protein
VTPRPDPAPAKGCLIDFGAGVSVDFQPNRDLDDDGRLPLHGHFPRFDFCRRQSKVTASCCQPTVSTASSHRRRASAGRLGQFFARQSMSPRRQLRPGSRSSSSPRPPVFAMSRFARGSPPSKRWAPSMGSRWSAPKMRAVQRRASGSIQGDRVSLHDRRPPRPVPEGSPRKVHPIGWRVCRRPLGKRHRVSMAVVWPARRRLFREPPQIQRATVRIEDVGHASTECLPPTWERTDE